MPYHAEKYVCVFDFNNMNATDVPYKYLYEVMIAMNLYYCGNVEKTVVYNAKGINSIWSFVKGFIPEHARKKILFVNSSNREDIFEYIDPYELEKRYGGKLDNLEEYWPPRCTNEEFDAIQMLKAQGEEAKTED